jgi:chemotaxis signal transduction protein
LPVVIVSYESDPFYLRLQKVARQVAVEKAIVDRSEFFIGLSFVRMPANVFLMTDLRMNNEAVDNMQPSFGEASATGALRKLQLVRAGAFHFGIFASEIATTASWRKPTPLPLAPKSVLGVVSIQGRMLTVLDLTTLTSREPVSSGATLNGNRHLIALRGDEQLALAVDALGDTVDVLDRDLQPRQETAGTLSRGTLQLEDSEISILNLKEFFLAAIEGRQRRQRRF